MLPEDICGDISPRRKNRQLLSGLVCSWNALEISVKIFPHKNSREPAIRYVNMSMENIKFVPFSSVWKNFQARLETLKLLASRLPIRHSEIFLGRTIVWVVNLCLIDDYGWTINIKETI